MYIYMHTHIYIYIYIYIYVVSPDFDYQKTSASSAAGQACQPSPGYSSQSAERSVLQCVAVCGGVLWCVAVSCSECQ